MTAFESPDELLVVAAILGNLEAFEELVVRYRPAVVRLARTIVGADYAEDVAQDSLLLAFKALPGIEEPRKFGAWLSAITRHRALRFSKSETTQSAKRVPLDVALLEKIEAGQIDPSFVVTHPSALEDAPEMYRKFRDKKDGVIKVVLRP